MAKLKLPKPIKPLEPPKRIYLTNPKVNMTKEEAKTSLEALTADLDADEYSVSNFVFVDEPIHPDYANLVSSKCESGKHAPVIDIDVPISVYPSSQLGHNHLYIDKEITWNQYTRLLKALASAGIIEDGYLKASLAKGYSAVRPVGITKPGSPRGAEVLVENAKLRKKLSDKTVEVDYLQKQLDNSVPNDVLIELERLKSFNKMLKADIKSIAGELLATEEENMELQEKVENLEYKALQVQNTLHPVAYKTTWG